MPTTGAAVICGVVLNLFLYGSYSYYHHIADGWDLANCSITRVNTDQRPNTYSVEYPNLEGHTSYGVAPTHNKQAVLQVRPL
jgi:hypothetical protein